jgi:hypothetical protein
MRGGILAAFCAFNQEKHAWKRNITTTQENRQGGRVL